MQELNDTNQDVFFGKLKECRRNGVLFSSSNLDEIGNQRAKILLSTTLLRISPTIEESKGYVIGIESFEVASKILLKKQYIEDSASFYQCALYVLCHQYENYKSIFTSDFIRLTLEFINSNLDITIQSELDQKQIEINQKLDEISESMPKINLSTMGVRK